MSRSRRLSSAEQAEYDALMAKVSTKVDGRYPHFTDAERHRWCELARKMDPAIRFAPSTEELGRRFGHLAREKGREDRGTAHAAAHVSPEPQQPRVAASFAPISSPLDAGRIQRRLEHRAGAESAAGAAARDDKGHVSRTNDQDGSGTGPPTDRPRKTPRNRPREEA